MLARYPSISSAEISVPSKAFILSGSNFTRDSFLIFGYTSATPSTTSPHPSSSISSHALFIASSALFGSRPFSNFDEASVLIPSLFDESLMFVPSNVAASKSTFLTLSLIMEFCPPMIPATPTGFSASHIISTSLSSVCSLPSSVMNFSPSSARLTTIFPPAMVSRSYACIGWPYSSITKLVISTRLFIGRIPHEESALCIHFGDGPILIFLTTLAQYLGQSFSSSTLTSI